MAFCNNCGASLADGARFCTECGQKTAAPAPTAPPINEKPEPQQPVYTAPQQPAYTAPVQAQSVTKPAPKRRSPLPLILGGVGILVVIVIVLILVLGGKSDPHDPNLGIYSATQAEVSGIEIDVTDMYEDGFTIELKSNGKCSLSVDGDKASGTWSLEDGVFHVEGGGLDCEGTLKNGVITLENAMDSGVNLIFEKEGGDGDGDADDGSAKQPDDTGDGAAKLPGKTGDGDTETPPDSSADVVEASALQRQWNGTWYGCLYVSEATGDFSDIPSDFYDAYMIVDVDGEGKGQFAVYLANVEDAFALANCEASEAGLYAVDGTVAGVVDMYAYNWMFLPMPDYPDQYAMSDSIEDGDSLFEFALFMKQWGGSWQEEIDSDFAIVPPSVESYHTAIANGELPPVGFAPTDYAGSSSSGTEQPAATDAPSATEAPVSAPAVLHEGEPSSTGDGMLKSLDDLYRLTKWLWDMEYSYKRTYCTYDFVVDYCGVQGLDDGNEGPNSVSEQGDHYFFWKLDNTRYIYVGFRPNEAGDWVAVNMNTSGFQVDDIPAGITVSYETASSMGVEKSEFAGELSATFDEFMTEIKTTVNLTVPDAGWCYRLMAHEVRIYNVASLEQQNSGSPIILFKTKKTLDDVNFYFNDFENVKEIEDRTIGGLSMKGRTYDYIGMSWTEYYCELPSGVWMSITISKIDLTAGSEGDAILKSVSFE